jgi:chemotaxis protein methyltransferase CheR
MAIDPQRREQIETGNLLETVWQCFGEDYRHKPRPGVMASLQRAMARHGAATLTGMLEKLLHQEDIARDVLQTLTSDAAMMFGDSWYQQEVREALGPQLASFALPRIWISECTSPESLLTLLIMLEEEGLRARSTVYVTHRSARLLEQLRGASISSERLTEYESLYLNAGGRFGLKRYGTIEGQLFRFSQELLSGVVLAQYNIRTDTSFNEFEWIEARESLADLDAASRKRALSLYHSSLYHYGLLAAGHTPELDSTSLARAYRPLHQGSALYRKV